MQILLLWFDTSLEKCKKQVENCEGELLEEDYSHDLEDDILASAESNEDTDSFSHNEQTLFEFRDGTIMKKRKKQKVLRYHTIALNVDRKGHYRQLLMFTKWRKEEQIFYMAVIHMKKVLRRLRMKWRELKLDI